MSARPLFDVIDAVSTLIPKDLEKRDVLIDSLEDIKKSFKISTPETQYVEWVKFVQRIDTYADEAKQKETQWFKTVVDVINDKIDYKELL